MALDITKPESPGWWLARLGARLLSERQDHTEARGSGNLERIPGLDTLRAYAEGFAPLPEVPGVAPTEAQEWMRDARTNWMSLVIDSPAERLGVAGFRFGESSAADADANRIWQECGMDAESELVHYGALSQRRSFVIVEKGPDGRPRMLHKSARQVAVAYDPHDPRVIRAALYLYRDDWTGRTRATLWTREDVVDMVSQGADVTFPAGVSRLDGWDFVTLPSGDASVERNGLGTVPVVPFVNRRNRRPTGYAEHEDVLSVQNRITTGIIQLMAAGRYGAFRQRYAAGLEVDEDPVTGAKISPFKLDIKTLWTTESPDVKFGEFNSTDLRPYVAAVGAAVQDLAAISKTPPHYLLGQVVNVSGDALKAAETGLVSKIRSRQREYGESWESAMRLCFRILGDPRADEVSAETIWMDCESRTVSELADAAVKKQSAGVPWRQRMEDLGYTPAQIDRMEVDRAQDAMMAPEPSNGTSTVGRPTVVSLTPPQDQRVVIGRDTGVPQAA